MWKAEKDGLLIEEDEDVEHFQRYNVEFHVVYDTPCAPVSQPTTLHNEEKYTYLEEETKPAEEEQPKKVNKPPPLDPEEDFEFEFPEPEEFAYPYEAAVMEYVFKTFGQEKDYKIEDDPHSERDPYRSWETGCFHCGEDGQ